MNINKYQTVDEIKKRQEELATQNKEFAKLQKEIEKKITGKLWLLFFIPILGLIIYLPIINNRKQREEFNNPLIKIKTELAKNELERMLLDKKLTSL